MTTKESTTSNAPDFYCGTARKFEVMIGAGVFGNDRVGLLGGMLIVLTQSPPHIHAVEQFGDALGRLPGPKDWTVRQE